MSVDINKEYDYPCLSVVRKPEEVPVLVEMKEQGSQRTRRRRRKQKPANPFEGWCMPEQPGGYIKGKNHEFF